MKTIKLKRILIIICLFVGIGALFGGISMLINPDGSILQMEELLPYFKKLPFSDILFQDYIFAGISLIIVNGITNIIAAILIINNKEIGIKLGFTFGITLMLWITIQFFIFPMNFLDIFYFIIGLIQFIIGYLYLVRKRQEDFYFNSRDYKINHLSKTLVVYFSRTGYTKKLAYEIAQEENANIVEITPNEEINSAKNFWLCGRAGMHNWPMEINEVNIPIEKYEKIILCTPIWVFTVSSPIREFCIQYNQRIKNIEYVITHYRKNHFKNAIIKMNTLLGIDNKEYLSVIIRLGKVKKKTKVTI